MRSVFVVSSRCFTSRANGHEVDYDLDGVVLDVDDDRARYDHNVFGGIVTVLKKNFCF